MVISYSVVTCLLINFLLLEEQRLREEGERREREEQERKEREEREKLKAEEEARFLEETNNLNKVLEGQREELDKWKEQQQRKIQVLWGFPYVKINTLCLTIYM